MGTTPVALFVPLFLKRQRTNVPRQSCTINQLLDRRLKKDNHGGKSNRAEPIHHPVLYVYCCSRKAKEPRRGSGDIDIDIDVEYCFEEHAF